MVDVKVRKWYAEVRKKINAYATGTQEVRTGIIKYRQVIDGNTLKKLTKYRLFWDREIG